MKHKRTLAWLVLVIVSSYLLYSCATVRYYSQSVKGHMSIWLKKKDIRKLIATGDITPKLKIRLQLILKIREFASREMLLPDNYSFKSYVDIRRKHVVWNVIAAPEFSVKPKRFCFLVVGCLSYKGYFSKKKTIREARRLKKLGYDVAVGGVTAYSTLGWFADPVLSSYVYIKEADLAGLIFHELTHQLVYFTGDTTFNESFATAVEMEGVRRWMLQRGKPELAKLYFIAKQQEDNFMKLILKYRAKLQTLYAQEMSVTEKRRRKKETFKAMQREHKKLRDRGLLSKERDSWMTTELNNAMIVSAATYFEYVQAFRKMMSSYQNLADFYRDVKAMEGLTIEQRKVKLNAWLNRS